MLFKKKNILLKLLFYYKVLNKIISYVLFLPFSLHALYLLSVHDFKKLFEMYYIDNKLSRSWIIKIYFLFIFIIFFSQFCSFSVCHDFLWVSEPTHFFILVHSKIVILVKKILRILSDIVNIITFQFNYFLLNMNIFYRIWLQC